MATGSLEQPGTDADSTTDNPSAPPAAGYLSVAIVLLTGVALLLRALRIPWQPLWWDEGYSAYFATESLPQLISLTALDIHPPLYYALLHGWLQLWGKSGPVSLRTFSILAGVLAIPAMYWLARGFFPNSRRIALVAPLLIMLSPIHIFYSQEVRMYGLALVLGMVSTGFLWRLIRRRSVALSIGYVISAALGLYTLYYLGFLLLAHAIWALWTCRHSRRRLTQILTTFVAVVLLYLPWLIYAAPKLVNYVGSKVLSDQDSPLSLVQYIARHATAFFSGHVDPFDARLQMFTWIAVAALILLVAGVFLAWRRADINTRSSVTSGGLYPSTPYIALVTFVLLPLACGFLLNLRLPFFPEGGERVMLYVLPYILLLVASAVDLSWRTYHLGKVALIGLVVSAIAGVVTYYMTPRYVERDYRPIIAQVVQQGQAGDSFVAIFPWQLGYWRAYTQWDEAATAAVEAGTTDDVPTPLLLSDASLDWDEAVATELESALAKGTLWFPAPLSFGSTLPGEIEAFLRSRATNVENRWFSTTTRLSAWRNLPRPDVDAQQADFGPVTLTGGGVVADDGSDTTTSANELFAVALNWTVDEEVQLDELSVSIRLRDENGHVWANRDYAPLGVFTKSDASNGTGNETGNETATGTREEQIGLIVPAGLAPDRYRISVGVGISGTESLLYPSGVTAETDPLVDVAMVSVLPPAAPQPISRLPIQSPLTPPETRDGIAFVGHSGTDNAARHLAGTELDVTLFLQNRQTEPPADILYLSLLDDGTGVGGWEGWPLPNYPMESWGEDVLVQIPVSLYLPATLEPGEYELTAGLLDPNTGEKSAPVPLGPVAVKQRSIQLEPPAMATALAQQAQLGTHVKLLGYDQILADDAIHLTLYWQALQTLLPEHHIFVHLDDENDETLAQQDGPPTTVDGRAPSGSWLPGEYISTVHTVMLSNEASSAIGDLHLSVGVYNPDGNIRLPVSVDGASNGDAITLPVSQP